MSNYELYEKVLEAYKTDDEGLFTAAARNWIESAEEANFEDDEAKDLFASAKRHCSIWRSKAINARVSKGRMVECVKRIAELNLPNPYPEKYSVAEEIAKDFEKKDEKKHILGVVPNVHEGFEQFDGVEKEEKAEVTAEEEKPRLFGKRNKR